MLAPEDIPKHNLPEERPNARMILDSIVAVTLARVARAVRIPILRKDFIIDELQLLEALAAGASAVLLIARILTPAQLTALRRAAGALKLGTLVEVHDERELEGALAVDPTAIGV